MTDHPAQPPEQTIETETPLWRFSVSLWENTRAAQAALELQAAGWVVSHLLVAAFLAREGYLWDGREPEAIQQWRQDVTQSLRTLRTALPKDRPDLAGLRRSVAQAELEAEHVELGWWYHWLQKHPLPGTPAQQPLRLLAQNMAAAAPEPSPEALPALSNFAQALVPSSARETFTLELRVALEQSDPQL
jgi:uncharacterized protein (TIGR02444 family)